MMIGGHTNGIDRTLEFIANRCTFEDAECVRLTGGNLMAICIAGAIGNRWFLTHRSQRIPNECFFAVTDRIRIGVQLAHFVRAAGNCRTRINAIFDAIRSDYTNLARPTIAILLTYFRLTKSFFRLTS